MRDCVGFTENTGRHPEDNRYVEDLKQRNFQKADFLFGKISMDSIWKTD